MSVLMSNSSFNEFVLSFLTKISFETGLNFSDKVKFNTFISSEINLHLSS